VVIIQKLPRHSASASSFAEWSLSRLVGASMVSARTGRL